MAIYEMKLINHKFDKYLLLSLSITEINLIYSAKGVICRIHRYLELKIISL